MTPALSASPSAAPIRPFLRTLAPNAEETFNVYGESFYVKEAEYAVEIAFDDGDFITWDLAIGVSFGRVGYAFKKVRIRNTAAATNRVEAYGGFFELADHRLNIIESRNGSTASQVPSQAQEVSVTFANTDPVEILPLDYTRAEVWLAPSTFGTSWWGASAADLNGSTGSADWRRVGLDFSGFTKLNTRAPIFVKGNEGASVRAFVFKF